MKIGIFGGAFNPVHNGHINLLSSVLDNLPLKRCLLFLQKFHHIRILFLLTSLIEKLLSIAFKGIRQAEISDIEQEKKEKAIQ